MNKHNLLTKNHRKKTAQMTRTTIETIGSCMMSMALDNLERDGYVAFRRSASHRAQRRSCTYHARTRRRRAEGEARRTLTSTRSSLPSDRHHL
jgi:hypothetical protein